VENLERRVSPKRLPEIVQAVVESGACDPKPFLGRTDLSGITRVVQRVGPRTDRVHQSHPMKPQVRQGRRCEPPPLSHLLSISRPDARAERANQRQSKEKGTDPNLDAADRCHDRNLWMKTPGPLRRAEIGLKETKLKPGEATCLNIRTYPFDLGGYPGQPRCQ
jgi:hypothetical protein